MKIICAGDCGIDLYLPAGERRIGGITANVARHARDQFPDGDEVAVVSCLGDDEAAHLVWDAFAGSGIECLIETRNGATPVQDIEIQPDGERLFVGYEPGVLSDFRCSSVQLEAIRQCDLLIAPVYTQIVGFFEHLLTAQTSGLVAVDFADFAEHRNFELLEAHIQDLDIAFFALSRSHKKEIDRIADLARTEGKLLIVTLGGDGSIAFLGEKKFECPIEPASAVVDTTGAGDAFAATFLSRYCHGIEIEQSMQVAASVAALVVAQSGSYPSR